MKVSESGSSTLGKSDAELLVQIVSRVRERRLTALVMGFEFDRRRASFADMRKVMANVVGLLAKEHPNSRRDSWLNVDALATCVSCQNMLRLRTSAERGQSMFPYPKACRL